MVANLFKYTDGAVAVDTGRDMVSPRKNKLLGVAIIKSLQSSTESFLVLQFLVIFSVWLRARLQRLLDVWRVGYG